MSKQQLWGSIYGLLGAMTFLSTSSSNFCVSPKHLDWLIGSATDTGVPEEEEQEFPAQVADSKPRDVFIALPGIRAPVRRNVAGFWQSLAKFPMVLHCNSQQDLLFYNNVIFLVQEVRPHLKHSLVNPLHRWHEIPYNLASTALLHIAFDWKWPHESGSWPSKERQSCSPAGIIFVWSCLAELCQVHLQTGCTPLERHDYDHCFAWVSNSRTGIRCNTGGQKGKDQSCV